MLHLKIVLRRDANEKKKHASSLGDSISTKHMPEKCINSYQLKIFPSLDSFMMGGGICWM